MSGWWHQWYIRLLLGELLLLLVLLGIIIPPQVCPPLLLLLLLRVSFFPSGIAFWIWSPSSDDSRLEVLLLRKNLALLP